MNSNKLFTLIELMIVIAIIATIAVIAIPGLVRARISANEVSAVSTLRATATSQLQFSKAGLKDRDSDGIGEYGFYTELSGSFGIPSAGVLNPPAQPGFINIALGSSSSIDLGTASKAGYMFQMWLPVGDGLAALPEAGGPVALTASQNEVDTQEFRWACYSWPNDAGKSGNKAFFISFRDELLSASNQISSGVFGYSGILRPSIGDIYDPSVGLPDLAGPFLLEVPTPPFGVIWSQFNKS